jgi:hypothetical protein
MTGFVPVIHVLFAAHKTWMRGTEPAHDGYKRAGAAIVLRTTISTHSSFCVMEVLVFPNQTKIRDRYSSYLS